MTFTIRKSKTEQDIEDYYRVSFAMFKKHFGGSDESDESLSEKHRARFSELGLGGPSSCLYVAHDDRGKFAGALWVGVLDRDVRDEPCNLHVWVFDVEVDPACRGKGLGRRLMLQAETWAREKGIDRIGLHTFHDLVVALSLYRSMDYTERNAILRKSLTDSATASPKPVFAVRKRVKGEDTSQYFALRLNTYRGLVNSGMDLTEAEIQEIYPQFKTRLDLDNPDYTVFIAESRDGSFAGLIVGRTREGKMWIVDIETMPELSKQGVGALLVGHLEQWARRQKHDEIVVFMNGGRKLTLQLLESLGYEVTNYIMEKMVP